MPQAFDPRQHMLGQTFEIFHYYDTMLDSVELHHHDFFEVYFFLSGNVHYSIEGHSYHLLPGDVLLISPQELHRPKLSQKGTPYERIVLWINKTFLLQLAKSFFPGESTDITACFDTNSPRHTNLLRLTPHQQEVIKSLMHTLIDEAANERCDALMASACSLVMLLITINRAVEAAPPQCEENDGSAALIESVLEYINQHFQEKLSLDSVARQFFISKYHLSHEFKRLVGVSVYHYIKQRRLVNAKQMLMDGIPPTSVYQYCGFKDYANFYRAFNETYHISPKKYFDTASGLSTLP